MGRSSGKGGYGEGSPLENMINTIKSKKTTQKKPDLYKWRPVTFVKTDRNG